MTNDPERRVAEHNGKFDPKSYTFSRKPVVLVFYQTFDDINQAIAFEKQVKGWSRKKKDAIIANEWHRLPECPEIKYQKKSESRTRLRCHTEPFEDVTLSMSKCTQEMTL